MKNNLLYHFRFVRHYLLSRSKFDIHSPYVYKIYSQVLKDKTEYPEYYRLIEKLKGSSSLLSGKDHRLLFRLSRYFKPKAILVHGITDKTAVLFLASGFPDAIVLNIGNCNDIPADSGGFDMVFVSDDLPVDDISDYLSLIMQHIHSDSVLIFCNIHGSKHMREVWLEIKNHSSITLTIDLFNLGLAFCKEELTKEDFILRY
jgi:hypothetical protein